MCFFFFFSSRRRHTRCSRDWSSDVCSSDLFLQPRVAQDVGQSEMGLSTFRPSLDQSDSIGMGLGDRKSTRLNSSHGYISYAVFCLKKKNPVHVVPIPGTRGTRRDCNRMAEP